MINELAAKRLGFNDPSQAVGKTFGAGLVDNELGLVPVTIIGVVKDARFRSVKEPLDPIMFVNSRTGPHSHMIVRFQGDPAARPRRRRARLENGRARCAVQCQIQRRHDR